jgi:hypothetical protein
MRCVINNDVQTFLGYDRLLPDDDYCVAIKIELATFALYIFTVVCRSRVKARSQLLVRYREQLLAVGAS